MSGWVRSAIYRQEVARSRVCRARCSASYQAIPQASGRFRFPRHTDSKALGAALSCSAQPVRAKQTVAIVIDSGDWPSALYCRTYHPVNILLLRGTARSRNIHYPFRLLTSP